MSTTCLARGGTTFPCKTEALIWAILLEAGFADRKLCLEAYTAQVISCVTDQGFQARIRICMAVLLDGRLH